MKTEKMKNPEKKAEKRKKGVSFALSSALALCVFLFGCGGPGNTGSSSVPENSSENTLSSENSLPEPESAVSSDASSSLPEESAETSSLPQEGESSASSAASGDNEAFEEKFEANPLDAAYREASMEAVSNKDMAELAETYAHYWETEVNSGYERLMALSGNDKDIEAGQEQWRSGYTQAMEEIASNAAALGGSMASVEEATLRMEYYRSRAKEIYGMLYAYDPDFQYQFTQEAVG